MKILEQLVLFLLINYAVSLVTCLAIYSSNTLHENYNLRNIRNFESYIKYINNHIIKTDDVTFI